MCSPGGVTNHRSHLTYSGSIYLDKPQTVHPLTQHGKLSITTQVEGTAFKISELRQKDGLEWQTLRLRANEHGFLETDFARLRVWAVYGEELLQEWLLIRQNASQITYVLVCRIHAK